MRIETGTVDITKHFAAPVAAVFAAWSEEEAQRAWGDPGPGWRMAFERFRFAVGARITVPAGTVEGVYVGDIDVTVQYP